MHQLISRQRLDSDMDEAVIRQSLVMDLADSRCLSPRGLNSV
jgi:hypothetical protein